MNEPVLQCPFCDSTDIRFDAHRGPGASFDHDHTIWTTCCYRCGATFPPRYKKELLISQWQRRPARQYAEAALQSLVERCAKVADDQESYFLATRGGVIPAANRDRAEVARYIAAAIRAL